MTTPPKESAITIEEGLPTEASQKEEAPHETSRCSFWKRPIVWSSFLLLVAIGLIVGLSVGLNNRNKQVQSIEDEDKDDQTPFSSTLVPTPAPSMVSSTPVPTPAPSMVPTTGPGSTSIPSSTPVVPSTSTPGTGTSSPVPPLASTLQAIGPASLDPYSDCEALRSDLEAAALYLANSKIDSSACSYYHGEYRPAECPGCGSDGPTFAPGDDVPDGARPEAPSGEQGGEDSYQTNTQVEGVDEADFVKSNGELVFAIYGNEVVVLDVENVLMSRTSIDVFEDKRRRLSMPYPHNGEECYSSVQSLLLHEDRLVVIATGGCYYYGYYEDEYEYERDILSSEEATHVFVYDIASVPTDGESPLTRLSKSFIHGRYISARSIESIVHIITSDYINPYDTYTRYLDRYNFDLYPHDLPEYDYRLQAQEKANELYKDFADAFLIELKNATNDDTCGNLVRLSLFQTGQDAQEQLEFTGNGVLGGVTFVTSFDLLTGDVTTETTNVSAMFSPTSHMEVYSSQERLVLAGNGWSGNEAREWREETFLITYRLEGASATPIAVSHVPGDLLNQFSLDHLRKDERDFLRVATTSSEVWGLAGEDREWEQRSESTSQVMILEETSEQSMELVGMVTDIGRGERIYSVRFMGDRAFVVTFRQTDPFFTIDLSDVTQPAIVGELKIPGFSNYLHPIDDNLILAVGQNADENTGRTFGLQISLFDVSDFADPQRIQHYTESSDSYSDAQFDHRAFRYLPQTKVLILPVEVWHWEEDSFDGFIVYDISETEIGPRFRIEHASWDDMEHGCWSYSSFLGPRSLVFEGEVMTMKRHTVLLHDLETEQPVADLLNLDAGVTECDCYHCS